MSIGIDPEGRLRLVRPYRPPGRRALLVSLPVVLCVLLNPGAGHAQGGADSVWLASKGFYIRDQGALLHQTLRDIPDSRRTVTDILRQVPRIEVDRMPRGDTELWLHDSASWERGDRTAACPLAVLLNGSRIEFRRYGSNVGGAEALTVDTAVPVRYLTGIEVLEGDDAPIRVRGACGAVLLWTFQRRQPDDVDFTGALRGRVTRMPNNDPVPELDLTIEPAGLRRRTDAGGRFDFGSLPPGAYRLATTQPDGTAWARDVFVDFDQVLDLSLVMELARR